MTQARTVPQPAGRLAVAGGLALAVAVALYAVGRTHTPSYTMGLLGQHGLAVNRLTAQLGTAMLGLALVQLTLALWMYRKLHRGGASLFLLSLPVAVHCMFAYGVQLGDLRVAVHSLAGCFFYGAFAAKVLLVRSRRLPGWALPLAGGLLVTLVVVMWYSSALWYFDGSRLPQP